MMRTQLAAAIVSLLLAACSTGPPEQATPDDPLAPGASEIAATPSPSPSKTKGGKKRPGGRETPAPGTTQSPVGGGGGSSNGDDDDGGGSSTASGEPVHPQSGRYLYNQAGYEEFCQGAACQKENLPATQELDARYGSRSDDAVTVITEARVSDNRTATTTYVYGRNKATVTNLTVDFAYGAISFHDSIDPKPPIDAALYPLEEGRSWSGSWTDDTSGEYEFSVVAHESLTVAGQTIDSYRLDTHIVFRGEFRGTTDAQIWVDPGTGFILKSAGKLDVTSDFGTYRSSFLQTLRSGPGYG